MACEHEHEHDHGHGHEGGPLESGENETLFSYIDLAHVRSMNVSNEGDVAKIIRPYKDRFDETPVVESDADEEMIIVIPFVGSVKLHSVLFRSLGDESSPKEIKLYKNQPQISFDDAENLEVTQAVDYPANIGLGIATSEGSGGIVEFALQRPKFANTQTLSIYISANHGAETTKLAYIGIRGEFSALRQAPVKFSYELVPNPKHVSSKATQTGNETV